MLKALLSLFKRKKPTPAAKPQATPSGRREPRLGTTRVGHQRKDQAPVFDDPFTNPAHQLNPQSLALQAHTLNALTDDEPARRSHSPAPCHGSVYGGGSYGSSDSSSSSSSSDSGSSCSGGSSSCD